MTDLIQILKNVPEYTSLYCPCFGEMTIKKVDKDSKFIVCESKETKKSFKFDFFGRVFSTVHHGDNIDMDIYFPKTGECMLFPSRECRTWDKNWQQYIMPQCVGSVIIDNSGYPYLIGKDYCYSDNPSIKDEIVRIEKFCFSDARFADKKECEKYFRTLLDNGWEFDFFNCEMVKFKDFYERGKCVVCSSDVGARTRDGNSVVIVGGTPLFVNNYNGFSQIVDVSDIHGQEFKVNQKYLRSWELADAKDGDILSYKNDSLTYILVVKSFDNARDSGEAKISYHIIVHLESGKYDELNVPFIIKNDRLKNLRVANADERRRFLSSMDGFRLYWDSERKILFHNVDGKPKHSCGDKIEYNGSKYIITKLGTHGYTVRPIDGGECSEIGYLCERESRITTLSNRACDFSTFDRVLCRDTEQQPWTPEFYSHYDAAQENFPYVTIGKTAYRYCIPYNEKTEHLAYTTKKM